MKHIDDFVPQAVGEHTGYAIVTVALCVPRCAACRLPLVREAAFGDQARRAGWPAARTHAHNADGRAICDRCAELGHARFDCALCGNERPFSDVQEAFGVGGLRPDYLCRTCFQSASAEKWLAKREELMDDHRDD
ncbi:hypothetical protein LZC95_19595 [Pendulispora brunnea]|uniref:Stc1 domain-containing protein n=1 Tax=Pendulispora brunnea TaxID=2905690 RepID=A0ABZ2KK10_9BACT